MTVRRYIAEALALEAEKLREVANSLASSKPEEASINQLMLQGMLLAMATAKVNTATALMQREDALGS